MAVRLAVRFSRSFEFGRLSAHGISNPRVEHDAMVEQENEGLETNPSEIHSLQEEERLTVDSNGSGIRFLAVAVAVAVCYLAQPVLITLCISALLAFVLAPATEILQKLTCPRPLAASLSVSLAVLALYGITYFSYDRALNFMEDLPRVAGKFRRTILRVQTQARSIQKTSESVLPETTEEKTAVRVIPQTSWIDIMARNVGTLTEFVFLVSFIPFLVYFMLTGQEHLLAASILLFKPEDRGRARRTVYLMSSMVRRFLVGSLLVGIFMGAVSSFIFAMLRLPYFYFVGFLSGFLSLVPYLGIVLALLPPLVAGAEMMSAQQILWIVASVIILHLVALNLLYPKLLGNRLKLNPLAVTVALLFWGWLWGGIGLILALPITGAMKIIFDRVESLQPYGVWMGESSLPKDTRAAKRKRGSMVAG
jgi:predicted PurR-regulated permease PerM